MDQNSQLAGIFSNIKYSGKSRILNGILIVSMNLTVFPLLLAWTIAGMISFPLFFSFWKVCTRWDNDKIMRHLVWFYGRGWMLIMLPFVKFRRDGIEKNKIQAPCIIVVNHLSYFDTYCMAMLPLFDITFALRSWPFKMLWYTYFMHLANYIDIEGLGWEKTLEKCRREIFLKKGILLVFPEGHRSRNGKLQRFYSGAFKISIEAGVPVVPLCITGTDTLFPPWRPWLEPAEICLSALPAVDPGLFSGPHGHVEMRKHVKQLMKEKIYKIRDSK